MDNRRRRSPRYAVKQGAIAMLDESQSTPVGGRSNPLTIGPVEDVSMDGMSVQYINRNGKKIDKQFKINIKVDYVDVAIVSIPVTQVADIEVERIPNSHCVRKLCLQFGELTEQQEAQVKDFIKLHTMGSNEERRSGADRRKYVDAEYNDSGSPHKTERRKGLDRRV